MRAKVISVAVATTKFIFGIYDCTVDIDVGTGDFSLLLGTLQVCGHAHMRSHVSPSMDCKRLFPLVLVPILMLILIS